MVDFVEEVGWGWQGGQLEKFGQGFAVLEELGYERLQFLFFYLLNLL